MFYITYTCSLHVYFSCACGKNSKHFCIAILHQNPEQRDPLQTNRLK